MPIKISQENINNVNTCYRHCGKGEPIVFLHGIPTSSFLWRKVMKELSEDFLTLAPDVPGFGNSENPQSHSSKWYSQWLNEFVETVACGNKTNLVIHDVGGLLGIVFALEHPEKINKLVIMDCFLLNEYIPFYVKIFMTKPGFWLYHRVSEKFFRSQAKRYLVNQSEKLPSELSDIYYQLFERDKKERNYHKIFYAHDHKTDRSIHEGLQNFKTPTLILWAEKDFAIPISVAKKIQATIKNSSLEILPNCGHFSQEEEPELIADKIRNFLKN
jgi:haloalkane dehalogenase